MCADDDEIEPGLTIVAWIEDRFALALDAGEIGQDDLRSVRAMCSLIEGVRTG